MRANLSWRGTRSVLVYKARGLHLPLRHENRDGLPANRRGLKGFKKEKGAPLSRGAPFFCGVRSPYFRGGAISSVTDWPFS